MKLGQTPNLLAVIKLLASANWLGFRAATVLILFAAATSVHAADFYINLRGDDTYPGTTPSAAFRTLAGACRKAPSGKHSLHLAPGAYDETESVRLPSGVSLLGAGIGQTIITWRKPCNLDQNPMAYEPEGFLIQVLQGQGGAISGITLRGSIDNDRRAYGGILAKDVTDFTIHHCEFISLEFCGVWLTNATHSAVNNCKFEDCGHPSKVSCSGAILIGPASDCAIYDNILREHRGAYGIKGWNPAWKSPTDWAGIWGNLNKIVRTKFFNNDIDLRQHGAWGDGQPNMDIELWATLLDDCEIYGNRFRECISLVGSGTSPRSLRIHHNRHLLKPGYNYAIEAAMHGLEIDNNYFLNGAGTIASYAEPVKNLYIHNNTFDGVLDINVINMPGLIDFRFQYNTVVVKKDIPLISLNKFPKDSRNLDISNNLFIKEGGPALTKPLLSYHGEGPSCVNLSANAYGNWNHIDEPSGQVIDPGLERSTEGDPVLRLKAMHRPTAVGESLP